jgi:hypothetical protein
MSTIVEYRSEAVPLNAYPARIVSPPAPAACCTDHMGSIGEPFVEGRITYQYKRCTQCGFTVRRVVASVPDAGPIEQLRETFRVVFGRDTQPPSRSTAA